MDSAQAAGTMQLEIRELSLDINWNKRLFLFPTASAASLCMSAPLHTRLLEHQPTPHFILHHIKIPTHFLCWCDASFIIIFYSSVLMVIMIMSCHAHVLQLRKKNMWCFYNQRTTGAVPDKTTAPTGIISTALPLLPSYTTRHTTNKRKKGWYSMFHPVSLADLWKKREKKRERPLITLNTFTFTYFFFLL